MRAEALPSEALQVIRRRARIAFVNDVCCLTLPTGRGAHPLRQLLPQQVQAERIVLQGYRLGQVVKPAHRRGSASHMVTGFAAADALADVPAETDRVEPGVILPVRSLA